MYTDFVIKNFRVFDNEGVKVPLRPITILTGCNNSGKSSITKALCMLKDFCRQVETDFNDGKSLRLDRYKIDFLKSPINVLGTFNDVIHRTTQKEDEDQSGEDKDASEYITFEVEVESSWLLQDVVLRLDFASLNSDDLNNAYLHAYSIKTLNGDLIYEIERGGKASMNFGIVKKSMLYFLYGQYAVSDWQNECQYREMNDIYPAGEDKEADLFDCVCQNIIEDLDGVALVYLLEWQASHSSDSVMNGLSIEDPVLKREKKVEPSFVLNSPKLGVYCYFPCFEMLKDKSKNEIRQEINQAIEASTIEINSFDRKIINLLLDSFEESEAKTLHEYISQKEDERFFIDNKIFRFGNSKPLLRVPYASASRIMGIRYGEESDIPEKLLWPFIMGAMNTINKVMTGESDEYIDIDFWKGECPYYAYENNIDTYLKNVIEDVFAHLIPGVLSYSPISTVQPRRMYSLEENTDFSTTLKQYFETKRLLSEAEDNSDDVRFAKAYGGDYEKYQPCSFINKWLCQLNIAHHVEIKSHAGGYGVTVHLYNNASDEEGMLLADKGFGVLQLFAILLKMEIAIMQAKTNELVHVYGTKGLNEEIIQILRTYNKLYPITVALEEPECHLHPSLQSKFAEMIVEANKEYGVHFVVESHSEYFIRNLQLQVSHNLIDRNSISLLYINPSVRPLHIPAITDIGIAEDGSLKNEFGAGFFDESLRLSKELFKRKGADHED